MIHPRWYPETVTLPGGLIGYDDYGNPIYGDPEPYKARISAGERVVRSSNGTQEVSRVTVALMGDAPIDGLGELTLPEYGTRPIIGWRKVTGLKDVAYTEVFVS